MDTNKIIAVCFTFSLNFLIQFLYKIIVFSKRKEYKIFHKIIFYSLLNTEKDR